MKKKLKLSNLIKLCSLLVILILITACSPEEYKDMKASNLVVGEYNEIIEYYNKMSVDFTSFARAVDKELEKDKEDSVSKVVKRYNEKSESIFKMIERVEEKEFKYDEIEVVMEGITPMIADMYLYLDLIKDIEKVDLQEMQGFREEVRSLYLGIVEQSIFVTETFQEIYHEHILQKDDK